MIWIASLKFIEGRRPKKCSGFDISVFGQEGVHLWPDIRSVSGLIEKAMPCPFIEMYIAATAHGPDLLPEGFRSGHRDQIIFSTQEKDGGWKSLANAVHGREGRKPILDARISIAIGAVVDHGIEEQEQIRTGADGAVILRIIQSIRSVTSCGQVTSCGSAAGRDPVRIDAPGGCVAADEADGRPGIV